MSSAMIQSHGECEGLHGTVGWYATWRKGVSVLKAAAIDLSGRITYYLKVWALEADYLGLNPVSTNSLATKPQVSYLTSVYLSLLKCKTGRIVIFNE